MPRLLLATLVCLLLCQLSRGDGEGGAPPDIAPVLSAAFARARASGALERALAPRTFRDRQGGLVTVRGALDEDAGELRWEAAFTALGAMREETLRLEARVGLDGRVRGSSFRLVRGVDRSVGTGLVLGNSLRLALEETRGGHTDARQVEVPWGADVLPFTLAVFVIPLLVEAGLPPELSFRAYHPVQMLPQAQPCRLQASGDRVLLSGLLSGEARPTVVELRSGAILRIDLAGADLLEAISAEEADRLAAPR